MTLLLSSFSSLFPLPPLARLSSGEMHLFSAALRRRSKESERAKKFSLKKKSSSIPVFATNFPCFHPERKKLKFSRRRKVQPRRRSNVAKFEARMRFSVFKPCSEGLFAAALRRRKSVAWRKSANSAGTTISNPVKNRIAMI